MGADSPFGAELRALRLAAGLSQEALAVRAGMSTDAIAALERGRRRHPRPSTVHALSDALGIDTAAARLQAAQGRRADVAVALPEPVRPIVGRERERAELVDLLTGPTRMVTLTGPGGVGKTRLALAVARRLAESGRISAYWVWLGAVSDAALLPTAVATAVGAREEPDLNLVEAVLDRFDGAPAVVVLDDCEHLVTAAADWCAELMARSRRVQVVATSREPLGVPGEIVRPVRPLPTPATGADVPPERLGDWPATRLFLDRARDAVPDLAVDAATAESIARVCRRLDGLPLAIELAAARMDALTAGQLAADLETSLRTVVAAARARPDRHRTLDAAIAWSYDLLDPAEQILLARLSVASGGWTVEAAQHFAAGGAVDPANVLELTTRLVRKSLLVLPDRDGLGRYGMLRVIRLHAAERLAASGDAAVRERHARYYTDLAERAAAGLRGPDQRDWLRRLDPDVDNLRAALRYWHDVGAADEGLRIATAVWRFDYLRGRYTEGRDALDAALRAAATAPEPDPVLRAGALVAAGTLAYLQCEYETGARYIRDGLALFRTAGEVAGMADALQRLGSIARERGSYPEAVALHEEGLTLWRTAGEPVGVAEALNYLAFVAWLTGDWTRCEELATDALGGLRGSAESESAVWALLNLGIAARYRGAAARADALLRESVDLCDKLGYAEGKAWSLDQLGALARDGGQLDRAWELQQESLALHVRIGDRWRAASVLDGLAATAALRDRHEAAARLLGTADALRASIGTPRPPCERDQYESAVATVTAALGIERYVELATVPRPERMLVRLASDADQVG